MLPPINGVSDLVIHLSIKMKLAFLNMKPIMVYITIIIQLASKPDTDRQTDRQTQLDSYARD